MKKLVFIVIAAIVALWIAWAAQEVIVEALGWKWKPELLGPWGDTFGAFNALFAALGFGAVILTLAFQQKQILESKKIQYLEQFDKSFFQLLNLLREARSEVRFRHSKEYVKEYEVTRELHLGIPAFRYMWLEVHVKIRGRNALRQEVAKAYEDSVHRRYEATLGPYFRLFYTMLKRLDTNQTLSERQKEDYGNLLRGQLTSYEIAVAGLNGLSLISKDMATLLSRYRFFKYLPHGVRRSTLSEYYPAAAFEGREEPTDHKLFFRREI